MDDDMDVLIYEDADDISTGEKSIMEIDKRIAFFQKPALCSNLILEAEKIRGIRLLGVNLMLEIRQETGNALNLCRYWCALCNVSMSSSGIVTHLTTLAHKLLYVENLFPSLHQSVCLKNGAERAEMLQNYDEIIHFTVGETSVKTSVFRNHMEVKELLKKKISLSPQLSYYNSINADGSQKKLRKQNLNHNSGPMSSPRLTAMKTQIGTPNTKPVLRASPQINSAKIRPILRASPQAGKNLPVSRSLPTVVTIDDEDDLQILSPNCSTKRENQTKADVPLKRMKIAINFAKDNAEQNIVSFNKNQTPAAMKVVSVNKNQTPAAMKVVSVNKNQTPAAMKVVSVNKNQTPAATKVLSVNKNQTPVATAQDKPWISTKIVILRTSKGHEYDGKLPNLPNVTYVECNRTDMNFVLIDKLLKGKNISLENVDTFVFFPFDWILTDVVLKPEGMVKSNNDNAAAAKESKNKLKGKISCQMGNLKSSYPILSKKYPNLKVVGVLPHPINYTNIDLGLNVVLKKEIVNLSKFKSLLSINQYSMIMLVTRLWLKNMPNIPFLSLMDLVIAQQHYRSFVNGAGSLQWTEYTGSDCVGFGYSQKFQMKIWSKIKSLWEMDNDFYKEKVNNYLNNIKERNLPETGATFSKVMLTSELESYATKRSVDLEQIGICSSIFEFTEEFAYQCKIKEKNSQNDVVTQKVVPVNNVKDSPQPLRSILKKPVVLSNAQQKPVPISKPLINSQPKPVLFSKPMTISSQPMKSILRSPLGALNSRQKPVLGPKVVPPPPNSTRRSFLEVSHDAEKNIWKRLENSSTEEKVNVKTVQKVEIQKAGVFSVLNSLRGGKPNENYSEQIQGKNVISLNKGDNSSNAAENRLNKRTFTAATKRVIISSDDCEVIPPKKTIISLNKGNDSSVNSAESRQNRMTFIPDSQKSMNKNLVSLNKQPIVHPNKMIVQTKKVVEEPKNKSIIWGARSNDIFSKKTDTPATPTGTFRLTKESLNTPVRNESPKSRSNFRLDKDITPVRNGGPKSALPSNPTIGQYSPLHTLNILCEAKIHLGFLGENLLKLQARSTHLESQTKDSMVIFQEVDCSSLIQLCLAKLKKAVSGQLSYLDRMVVNAALKPCEKLLVEIGKMSEKKVVPPQNSNAKHESNTKVYSQNNNSKPASNTNPFKKGFPPNDSNAKQASDTGTFKRNTGTFAPQGGNTYKKQYNPERTTPYNRHQPEAHPMDEKLKNMTPLMRQILNKGTFEMKNFYNSRATTITELPTPGSLREKILLSASHNRDNVPIYRKTEPVSYNSDFASRSSRSFKQQPKGNNNSVWRLGSEQ